MYYQEFVEKQFENALNQGLSKDQLNNECYKYALKQMLGVYAETYRFGNKEFKFWNKDFHIKSLRGKKIWTALLGSIDGYKLCECLENGTKSLKETAKEDQPYYEHIEPRGFTYERLIELNGTKATSQAIHDLCRNSKIIILSHEESKRLDAKGFNRFTDKDIELLKAWEKDRYITKDILDEALKSMESGTKDCGTAYARFAHLCTNGIEFKWGRDPKSKSGKSQIELFKDYIEDENRKIQ